MSLRLKLILGFAIPSLMLLVVGVWSSTQMRLLGSRVRDMLDMNERSIRAAVRMNEAIERLDSGVLLRLHGDEPRYQRIHTAAVIEFKDALGIAVNNITIPGEKELLDTLQLLSTTYLRIIDEMGSTGDLDNYWIAVFPVFRQMQQAISDLSLRNSEQMYSTAQGVTDRASRAALPGDLIIVAAVVFYLLFAWLTQYYVVRPIRLLLRSVDNWNRKGRFDAPQVETGDEIERLIAGLRDVSMRVSLEAR
jgi:hypothetical protein